MFTFHNNLRHCWKWPSQAITNVSNFTKMLHILNISIDVS